MSNETQASPSPVKTAEVATPPTISRNGVDKLFVQDQFGKNSPNAGVKFFKPEVTIATLIDDLKWIGDSYTVSVLNRSLRRNFAEMALDNVDESTGVFNADQWNKDAITFDEGSQSLSDLNQEIDDLQGKMSLLALDPNFGDTDNTTGTPTPEAISVNTQIATISKQLQPLRALRQKIKTEYAARIAKKDATQKANEEKAKAAALAGNTVPVAQLAQS